MLNAISVLSMSLLAQKTLELPSTVWHVYDLSLYTSYGYGWIVLLLPRIKFT